MPPAPQIYRHGTLGFTLIDTIDDFTVDDKISPQLGKRVLEEFDRIIYKELGRQTKAKMTFKGELDVYQHCDNIWRFNLKNVTFKMEGAGKAGTSVVAKRVKVVSYNADP